MAATQFTKRIKYVKKARKFQKPGITHNFPDSIPDIKLDQQPAVQAITNRLRTDEASVKAVFKNIFDTLSKSKQSGTFENEMAKFKAVQILHPLKSIASGNVQKDLISKTSLESADKREFAPDIGTMNDLLRCCANKADAQDASMLLTRMQKDFGVKPTEKSTEIVAYAYLKAGNQDEALKVLSTVKEVSDLGQFIVWRLIRDCLSKDNSEMAWSLFNGLRAKVLPAPEICGTMLMHCGKLGLTEMAFKTYVELQGQGLAPHWLTHSALIYAASKRKEYYPRAIELFKEMEDKGMNIDIRVYNNILQGTAKVADLKTAIEVWNRLQAEDATLKINDITVASMLWSLAATETSEDKISKREFHYDMDPQELKRMAEQLFQEAQSIHKISVNAYLLNAYLAVMANHNFVEEAELIFGETFAKYSLNPTPASYEIILKLYDAQRNFGKTSALIQAAQDGKVLLGFEAWRAAIRTAALTKNLPVALDWLKSMVSAGHKPTVESLKVLHLRLCEEERWQLRKEMGDLCLPPVVASPNPYASWRQRSVAIASLLQRVYGKDAPQLTTNLD